jgi:hypothetical protein
VTVAWWRYKFQISNSKSLAQTDLTLEVFAAFTLKPEQDTGETQASRTRAGSNKFQNPNSKFQTLIYLSCRGVYCDIVFPSCESRMPLQFRNPHSAIRNPQFAIRNLCILIPKPASLEIASKQPAAFTLH